MFHSEPQRCRFWWLFWGPWAWINHQGTFELTMKFTILPLFKSWFLGRRWGQQLFSFQSPAVQWMAQTSSLNYLCCRNFYQAPDSLFFTEKCFVASPSQKSALIGCSSSKTHFCGFLLFFCGDVFWGGSFSTNLIPPEEGILLCCWLCRSCWIHVVVWGRINLVVRLMMLHFYVLLLRCTSHCQKVSVLPSSVIVLVVVVLVVAAFCFEFEVLLMMLSNHVTFCCYCCWGYCYDIVICCDYDVVGLLVSFFFWVWMQSFFTNSQFCGLMFSAMAACLGSKGLHCFFLGDYVCFMFLSCWT